MTIAAFPVLTAAEAAAMIRHGDTVGFSGFTPAGAPKAIPLHWPALPLPSIGQAANSRSAC